MMKTRAKTWLAQIAVMLMLMASGMASGATGFLSWNSPLGKNAAEAGYCPAATSLSGESHRGCGELSQQDAAGLFVAPQSSLPTLPQGYHYRNVGGRIDVVRNPGHAADLPPLHLENGRLVFGHTPSVVRDAATRSAFLRQLADNPNVPSNIRPWLQRGEVPPGFQVHHRRALFDGGTDTIDNMVLQGTDIHTIIHRYYRPGGQIPSINPPATASPY
jgi:hypothetical protein